MRIPAIANVIHAPRDSRSYHGHTPKSAIRSIVVLVVRGVLVGHGCQGGMPNLPKARPLQLYTVSVMFTSYIQVSKLHRVHARHVIATAATRGSTIPPRDSKTDTPPGHQTPPCTDSLTESAMCTSSSRAKTARPGRAKTRDGDTKQRAEHERAHSKMLDRQRVLSLTNVNGAAVGAAPLRCRSSLRTHLQAFTAVWKRARSITSADYDRRAAPQSQRFLSNGSSGLRPLSSGQRDGT